MRMKRKGGREEEGKKKRERKRGCEIIRER